MIGALGTPHTIKALREGDRTLFVLWSQASPLPHSFRLCPTGNLIGFCCYVGVTLLFLSQIKLMFGTWFFLIVYPNNIISVVKKTFHPFALNFFIIIGIMDSQKV